MFIYCRAAPPRIAGNAVPIGCMALEQGYSRPYSIAVPDRKYEVMGEHPAHQTANTITGWKSKCEGVRIWGVTGHLANFFTQMLGRSLVLHGPGYKDS